MAAKVKQTSVRLYIEHPKTKRPGVHAKSKTSNLKTSKHYVKPYRGQGR